MKRNGAGNGAENEGMAAIGDVVAADDSTETQIGTEHGEMERSGKRDRAEWKTGRNTPE